MYYKNNLLITCTIFCASMHLYKYYNIPFNYYDALCWGLYKSNLYLKTRDLRFKNTTSFCWHYCHHPWVGFAADLQFRPIWQNCKPDGIFIFAGIVEDIENIHFLHFRQSAGIVEVIKALLELPKISVFWLILGLPLLKEQGWELENFRACPSDKC